MSPFLRKILDMNWALTALLAGLLIFGVHAIAIAGEGNPSQAIQNAHRVQTNWILLGTLAYLSTSLVDYRWIRWAALPALFAGIGLLVMALFTAEEINDTKGWLRIGSLTFQPSQFAMAGAIIAASIALGDLRRVHPIFKQPFVSLGLVGFIMGLPCLLTLAQGDVGSALVWLPVSAAVCLVGNIPFRHLALVALTALTVIPPFYFFGLSDARRARIEVYLDMLNGRPVDIQGNAYAAHYASTAVASGGWNGFANRPAADDPASPLLQSPPDPKNSVHAQGLISRKTAHTDYIFAVIAERYGFRGSALLILAYCAILAICLAVGYAARDLTGRLVATGVAALLFAHVFQNIGMNVLLTPITGIPLPFVSYGGTFMLVTLFLIGMVQSVWIHREVGEPEPAIREIDSVHGIIDRVPSGPSSSHAPNPFQF